MFEISVACKYLVPRARYLSVSIISIISVLVIATVVWLTVVFFSATEGLERRWTEKLISITAPVRVLPTDAYYQSYYYLIDTISEASHYTAKTLLEKLDSQKSDPYNPAVDSLPDDFPQPLYNKEGQLVDLVKEAYKASTSVRGVSQLTADVFETAFANVKMQLAREIPDSGGAMEVRILSKDTYLTNFDPENTILSTILLPLSDADRKHLETLYHTKEISDFIIKEKNGIWQLPETSFGQGVLLPKSFQENGVFVGDRGTFSYYTPTATALQEQFIPFVVAGFYDPGIIPIGGKLILVKEGAVAQIAAASHASPSDFPTGLNVRFPDYTQAAVVQKSIQQALKAAHIAPYFSVETYTDYDFTKDIFQQLKSEKNLFSLISLIVVIVACSNIISMLIILIHDKKKEIAIMRALGASKASIGCIFGISGLCMGAAGSVIGALAAYFTVKNLGTLLAFLGKLQGFDVLNAAFYGTTIPTEVSEYALVFVISATIIISCLAGICSASIACRQNTSEALRAE